MGVGERIAYMNDYIEYPKRYATARQISEGEAETHKTVQEVKAYYKDKDADKVQETRVNVGCGGAK